MAKIIENTISKIGEEFTDLLVSNLADIDRAFIAMNDSKLEISVKVKLDGSKKGIAYEVKMSFPTGNKVEDFVEGIIDDPQLSLLGKKDKTA